MLSLLETGRALYVLAGICVLSVLTRLMARNLYKRLLRESTNLAGARNRGLRELRQRAENAYYVNQGMRDTASWLEHQLGELHFWGFTLSGWALCSTRLTWLCLFAGGAAAFFSYWYRLDTWYIVMYGGGAVLMAMFAMLLDGNSGLAQREQLLAALQDHLENSMFPRMERGAGQPGGTARDGGRGAAARSVSAASGAAAWEAAMTRETAETAGNGTVRDSESRRQGIRMASARTAAARGGQPDPVGQERENGEHDSGAEAGDAQGKSRLAGRRTFSDRVVRGNRRAVPEAAPGPQEQTAAAAMPQTDSLPAGSPAGTSAVSGADGRNWLKELGPEEAKVIGDILKQYLT